MMEEILFYIIDCGYCSERFIVDHIEELPNGDVMCPHCRMVTAHLRIQGVGASAFADFSEEARIKICDAVVGRIEGFEFPFLRRVLACECGFSAIQTDVGSRLFRCDHCGKVRTVDKR